MKCNWILKMSDAHFKSKAKKLGAWIVYPNGTEAIDMDIMEKHNKKCQAIWGLVWIGSAIAGAKLGKWRAKNKR